MSTRYSFSILMAILVGLILFYTLRYFFRKYKIKRLERELNLKKSGAENWSFLLENRKIRLCYWPGSRNQFPRVVLIVPAKFKGHCRIRREHIWDKIAKALGVNYEIQTLDLELDKKYYFECEDPQFIAQITPQPVIKDILAKGLQKFHYFEFDDNVVTLVRVPGDLSDFNSAEILSAAQGLVALVQDCVQIPEATATTYTPLTDQFESKVKAWQGFAGIAAFVPFFAFLFMTTTLNCTLEPFKVFLYSLPISGGIVGIWVVVAIVRLSRHSTSLQAITGIFFWASIAVGMGGWLVAIFGNSFCDHSPGQRHTVKVVGRHEYHGRYGANYYMHLQYWLNPKQSINFAVSPEQYAKVNTYDQCSVVSHVGALGYEWIERKADCHIRIIH